MHTFFGEMTAIRYRARRYTNEAERRRTFEDDVRRGLTGCPKSLPPKYFYDTTGSKLFEDITEQPEYYLTRTERTLLGEIAPALMREVAPRDLIELGAGSALKTRRLLDARRDQPVRYIPIDVDEGMIQTAASRLLADYPLLSVEAIVEDFERHLHHVPVALGRRLVLFLGSTIGNLDPLPRRGLLTRVRSLLAPGDRFLVGLDLVKDVGMLEAAYDDASGVTREFNRNILAVVNRELDADFLPEAFAHVAFYNEAASRVEMHLVPDTPQLIHVGGLGLTVHVATGEGIWTESCYKFTRQSVVAMLEEAGLELAAWHVDPGHYFALALAAPA
jgi:L-histidine Nalpha-methyltransferase